MARSPETSSASAAVRGYPELHDHIDALRAAALLIEIDREINNDTEMHPLVRWQDRGGIAPEDRRAFLFTNIFDSKGRRFDIPVLVCGLAGNTRVYSLGMGCPIEEVRERWIKAMGNPIRAASSARPMKPPRTIAWSARPPSRSIANTGRPGNGAGNAGAATCP